MSRMTKYVVTIAPEETPDQATTLRIDANGAGTRVIETNILGGYVAPVDVAAILAAFPSNTTTPEPEPAPVAEVKAAPVKKAPAKKAAKAAPKKTAAKPAGSQRRFYGPPSDLADVAAKHGGDVKAIAEEYGAAVPTVKRWLEKEAAKAAPAAAAAKKSARKATTVKVTADPKTPFSPEVVASEPAAE